MRPASLLFVLLLATPAAAAPPPYVWPISGTTAPDPMNTSFGPRMNYSHWDMHDGIDIPETLGTAIVAVRSGTVFLEGAGGDHGYSSRHVVIKVDDPSDGEVYVVHVHMNSTAVVEGAWVNQGDTIGAVGDDDATYAHLHIEFRKNSPLEAASVHPLHYLPYADTANFSAPVLDRVTVVDSTLWVRLSFGAADRNEGDLKRVEVDLKDGAALIATRIVDFDDKTTINEGNSDALAFVNDIAVEGYQSSNMGAAGWTDLKHGIIVRNLPASCDTLVARVADVGGNTSVSGAIAVPPHLPRETALDFEGGVLAPAGWTSVASASGTGTTVMTDSAAAKAGAFGAVARDTSTAEGTPQTAAVSYDLPAGRIQWAAEAWLKPLALGLSPGDDAYVLYFLNAANLSVTARIRNVGGTYYAGISALKPGVVYTGADSSTVVSAGSWRRWKLLVKRLGTRTATPVLLIDGSEVLRLPWDSTAFEPLTFRSPLGLVSAGATIEIAADNIRLGERTDPPPLPPVVTSEPPLPPPPPPDYGTDLEQVLAFPNPARGPGAVVRFRRVPPDATLSIYTIDGSLVRSFGPAHNAGGNVLWDTGNGNGRPVASGVYLCLLKDSRGNRAITKIVVVR